MLRSAFVAALLGAVLAAAAASAATSSPHPDESLVQAAAAEAMAHVLRHDAPACRPVVDRVAHAALAAWTPASRAWLEARVMCLPDHLPPVTMSRAQLDAIFGPLQALLARAPSLDERSVELAVRLSDAHVNALLNHGWADDAKVHEAAFVRPWLARLARNSADGVAAAALRHWASRYYGARDRVSRIATWRVEVAAVLGEGHSVELQLLAAAAFGNRLLGRPEAALRAAEALQMLTRRHHGSERRRLANAASEMGLALAAQGRLTEAMTQVLFVREALLEQQPTPHASLMRANYNLASLAFEAGDDDAAVAYADVSIAHSRQQPDKRTESEALAAMFTRGMARLRRGDAEAAEALRQLIDSLPHESVGSNEPAFALARHAQHRGDAGTLTWAQGYLHRYARIHMDVLHADRPLLGMLDAALEPAGSVVRRSHLQRALAFALVGRSGTLEAQAWFTLAADHETEHPDLAIWFYKRGANVLQQRRGELGIDDPGAQRAWLADHEGYLRRFVALLIDRGRLAEAQQALRVLRDEELHEYTRRSEGGARRGSSVRLALVAHERLLDARLAPVVDRLRAEAPAADARADAVAAWSERLRRRDDALQAAIDVTAERLGQLAEPSAVAPPEPAAANAAEPPLAAGERRLTYFVRPQGLDIVVQGPFGLKRLALPVPATELARQVHTLRTVLARPSEDARIATRVLYERLLAPVLPWLQGATAVRVVADGVLRFVPFGVLHDGRRYAAERWVLVNEAIWGAERRGVDRSGRQLLVALGRTTGDRDHAALPGVALELAGLPHTRSLSVRRLLDGDFTAAALAGALAKRPLVVHLASHFVLGAPSEQGAYLLLGDGERMPLPRLRALPWQGVHLAVLSACDTGVPEPGVPGRQLSGLAAVLHDAGAANVLATLWPVTDDSTSAWMQDFYRQGGGRAGLPQPAWVTQAQRRWLRRHAGTALAHPHHWAGFVWMRGV